MTTKEVMSDGSGTLSRHNRRSCHPFHGLPGAPAGNYARSIWRCSAALGWGARRSSYTRPLHRTGGTGPQLVEWLIGGAKPIFVGLIATQEVKSGKAPRDGLPDACRKQDNASAEVRVRRMIAGVVGCVGRPIRKTPQSGNRYAIRGEERQLEPAVRPYLMGHIAPERLFLRGQKALLGVLLTQAVQRHEGVQILVELGRHAGDPVLQTDCCRSPAQLATQLMAVLAPEGREIRLPIRRQHGGGAGLDLLDLDRHTMLHQAIVEERRGGRV